MDRQCPRDGFGRHLPHRLTGLDFLQAIPQMMGQFVDVPERFWTREKDAALVDCPCGETAKVELAQMQSCACGRMFFFGGRRLFSALQPKES